VRVLVIEDSRQLADLLAEGLRDDGFAVDIAYDGIAAADKIQVNTYDVVVLDRDLPGIHGDILCRMITGSEDPAMVLMLTAAGSPEDRVSGLGLGADDYLPKPFHYPELVLRIHALARRRHAIRAPVLRAAGIELDSLNRTVTRNGTRLSLSVKEFALLQALMRASPAVLSAEDLLEQVWDEHADPFTSTVVVTMSRLRRKLGPPTVIHNTPGIGYRITDPPDQTG
jgi:DNA-binding response OmpR family regulator